MPPKKPHRRPNLTPEAPGGPADAVAVRNALWRFCTTIEATGGVVRDLRGNYWPVGDPGWMDLAFDYMTACSALGRKPKCKRGRHPNPLSYL
jgi:hypothetical protein